MKRPRKLNGWSSDAKKAITENPDYFVWWYTVKSVGLGVVACIAAYYIGKEMARRQLPEPAKQPTLSAF
ncbi:MAG: hypothetical protein WAV09_03285 [Minisyncoccia bacterium]